MNPKSKVEILAGITEKIFSITQDVCFKGSISSIEIDLLTDKLKAAYDCLVELKYSTRKIEELSAIPEELAPEPIKPDVAPQSTIHNSPELTIKKSSDILSSKHLIDSLYGTPSQAKNEDNNPLSPSDTEPPRNEATISHESKSLATESDSKEDITLFDIGNNQDSIVLNEVLEANESKNIASAINSQLKKEIKDYIGINDKFLLMRDLFSNDIDVYNKTIDALNNFTEIDDAYIYLQENFIMNPENEAVKLLTSIIEQRFS
ncbi:MAG: hypothetical protein LIO79_04580 [Rikenellaceae bacterium]|nr:hypothetical protein [Rikenellaceae bacterium]